MLPLTRSFLCVGLVTGFIASADVQAQTAIQTIPDFQPVAASDDQLGSTMTLDELQSGNQRDRQEKEATPIRVKAAAEPVPALSVRLYPRLWELKPGQALLHYNRAQILFGHNSREEQNQWQSSEWLEGVGEGKIPTDAEVKLVIDRLKSVYDELHALAMSDDFTWDHRLRDIRGPEVYMYLLPDVQEIRTMARMLSLKIRYELRQKDFDAAFTSISDGLRLAEFVGQGETLIQKLVGIAIASIMRDQIRNAVSTSGCPNLYWAIAEIPRPLIDVRDSVLWELNNISSVLPVLAEAEDEDWTEAEAGRKWSATLADLNMLSGDGMIGDADFRVALAIASVAFVEQARERLLKSGYSEARLARLPGLQVMLIDAARELQRVGDDLGKAHLLPASIARPLLRKQDQKFQEWLKQNRLSSVAAAIGGVLYPAVAQAKDAETRTLMTFNRLMTLEAIRMHAAAHQGAVPDSLDQLDPVPALPDPYTAASFGYEVERGEGKATITLRSIGPANYKPLQTLKAIIIP